MAKRRNGRGKQLHPKEYIYLPARATRVASEEFRRRKDAPHTLVFGLPTVDSRVVPLLPGDLATVIGRPGMGKTSLLIYLAKNYARSLAGEDDDKHVLYATWETMVEEFIGVITAGDSGYSLEDIGRGTADLDVVEAAMVSILGNNLVVFGQSLESRGKGVSVPSLPSLSHAIEYLSNEMGLEIGVLLIDYLQRIPGNTFDRSSSVSENLERVKDMATGHGIPIVAAVQARRDVDDYGGLKFPRMSDGQWTSSIEQTSDRVFAVTMPGRYMETGRRIVLNGWEYEVTPTTMGLRMLKQRFGPQDDSDVWLLDFDPATIVVTEQEVAGEEKAIADAPY